MTSFVDRLKLGITAFREGYVTSSVSDTDDWSSLDARRLRYRVLWAWYEQTSYRDVHTWAEAYRKDYALYKDVRALYNPAYRLGEFWKAHLFGGLLDPEAGERGAIPIHTENERLRGAIAELWRWSKWQVRKDILSGRGTILGDAAVQVIDDVERQRVYLDLLHPGLLDDVVRDPFGNVKGYTLREVRLDPRGGERTVAYKEVVSRDGEFVRYETFLNGEPYAWPGNLDRTGNPVSTWAEPYGFVPLVLIQHNDVGLDWGWSELHPIRSKVQEADDLASMISDQARKAVSPVWLMTGMKSSTITLTGATADSDTPAPGREEIKAIWGAPSDAKAVPMVANMQFAGLLEHLKSVLKELERDVLELSPDIHTASGDASGRALRTARQPVAAKAAQRRAAYDGAMVAAQQMAIAIGGWRGYAGYEGFGLDSYAKGDLEHNIAERPVFQEDPLDDIEINTAFWGAAKRAVEAGVTLEAYLRDVGWDEERISALGLEGSRDQTQSGGKPR